jgi:UDP-GlcNAc:undecaprenyl-phosphate GlcNAc-1-phosphate transferase
MPFFRAVAIRLKVVDFPGKRKMHRVATPLLGGAAIYLGFLAGLSLCMPLSREVSVMLAGSTIVLLLGVADDTWGLSARLRIVVQLLAAFVVVVFGDRISFLPANPACDALEVIISLIWVVGITNAFNYLDGLDGLAGGSAVINLACFGAILYRTGQQQLFAACAVLAAACLGFLPHNFSSEKKRIFLGDAGATFLGFTLASIGLCGYWAKGDPVKIAIPILVLGVPIFDMVFTSVMRVAEKKIKTVHEWLKYAGKDHFHHYLVDLELTTPGAVIFIYFTSILLGLSAMIASVAGPITALMCVLQGFIVFGIIGVLIVMGKRQRDI